MEKITTVGIDLAKNGFSVHGVDPMGRVAPKKTVLQNPPNVYRVWDQCIQAGVKATQLIASK